MNVNDIQSENGTLNLGRLIPVLVRMEPNEVDTCDGEWPCEVTIHGRMAHESESISYVKIVHL